MLELLRFWRDFWGQFNYYLYYKMDMSFQGLGKNGYEVFFFIYLFIVLCIEGLDFRWCYCNDWIIEVLVL